MRWMLATVLVVAFAGVLHAEDAARRAQISAATNSAVNALLEEIGRQPLGRTLTIKDLLDRTGGSEELRKTLQRSRQIGGPRWIDDQTCQIRLEISGQRVANALVQIASANAGRSPVPPQDVGIFLRDWDQRVFSATGSSTGAAMIEHARPARNEGPWASVPDDVRKRTVGAAKRDAIAKYLAGVGGVALTGDKTIGEALADEDVQKAVNQWMSARPVTRIDFGDDLNIRLMLSIEPGEFADGLRVSLAGANSPLNLADVDWEKVANAVARSAVQPTGQARAEAGVATASQPAVGIPTEPPLWVDQWIDAEGSGSSPDKSKLRAARIAESDAMLKLRSKIEALSLTPQLTVAQAAAADARIESAVHRTVSRARVVKSDYRADGSVTVRVNLQLRDLWNRISSATQSD